MSLNLNELMRTPFQKEISEGQHKAKLTSMQYVPSPKNNANDYITMTWAIDTDCSYKRNMFARDVSIMLSHVRRQLGRADETIQPTEFLQELITNQTELDIWFSYPTVPTASGAARVQNIRWLPPVEIVDATSAVPADESGALEEVAG